MRINKQIRETFNEIAIQSLNYANNPDKDYRYIRRLLKQFDKFSDDEKIYIVKEILEQIRYRNIITDPDTVLNLSNITLRKHTLIFLLIAALMILASFLFHTNKFVDDIYTAFGKIITILFI